jgi:hypothetical protein
MVDPRREAGVGDSRFEISQFVTLQRWQARPTKQCLRVATQKKAKKNEAVDGMVRRRQGRWHWVVGESQMMRGEESQCLASADWEEQSLTRLYQSGTHFHCPITQVNILVFPRKFLRGTSILSKSTPWNFKRPRI